MATHSSILAWCMSEPGKRGGPDRNSHRPVGGHKQNLVHIRTQEKGAVTP